MVVLSFMCFPLGTLILAQVWESLSTLSVVTFTVDLLRNSYEITNSQRKEEAMRRIKNQSRGVNMG